MYTSSIFSLLNKIQSITEYVQKRKAKKKTSDVHHRTLPSDLSVFNICKPQYNN